MISKPNKQHPNTAQVKSLLDCLDSVSCSVCCKDVLKSSGKNILFSPFRVCCTCLESVCCPCRNDHQCQKDDPSTLWRPHIAVMAVQKFLYEMNLMTRILNYDPEIFYEDLVLDALRGWFVPHEKKYDKYRDQRASTNNFLLKVQLKSID